MAGVPESTVLPMDSLSTARTGLATARCELWDQRPRQPLSTLLIIDVPRELDVPFLICAVYRPTLDELHALMESASRAEPQA
jgi:hypothetical protein